MDGFSRNFAHGVVSRTQSTVSNFVSIGSGVWNLRGVGFWHSPLT